MWLGVRAPHALQPSDPSGAKPASKHRSADAMSRIVPATNVTHHFGRAALGACDMALSEICATDGRCGHDRVGRRARREGAPTTLRRCIGVLGLRLKCSSMCMKEDIRERFSAAEGALRAIYKHGCVHQKGHRSRFGAALVCLSYACGAVPGA